MLKHRKIMYALLGFGLGAAFPLGVLLFPSAQKSFFYIYALVSMPFVLAGFGYFLGIDSDRLEKQAARLEKLDIRLREQALTDELTGFHNRRQILIEVQREIDRARRYNRNLSGIMIGIADFKRVNERYGVNYGDHVLKEIAKTIHHCIRSTDVFGRYSGDEFVIVMPEADSATGNIVAARIQKEVSRHQFESKGEPLKVEVHIGIHFFDDIKDIEKTVFIETLEKSLTNAKLARKKPASGRP